MQWRTGNILKRTSPVMFWDFAVTDAEWRPFLYSANVLTRLALSRHPVPTLPRAQGPAQSRDLQEHQCGRKKKKKPPRLKRLKKAFHSTPKARFSWSTWKEFFLRHSKAKPDPYVRGCRFGWLQPIYKKKPRNVLDSFGCLGRRHPHHFTTQYHQVCYRIRSVVDQLVQEVSFSGASKHRPCVQFGAGLVILSSMTWLREPSVQRTAMLRKLNPTPY